MVKVLVVSAVDVSVGVIYVSVFDYGKLPNNFRPVGKEYLPEGKDSIVKTKEVIETDVSDRR